MERMAATVYAIEEAARKMVSHTARACARGDRVDVCIFSSEPTRALHATAAALRTHPARRKGDGRPEEEGEHDAGDKAAKHRHAGKHCAIGRTHTGGGRGATAPRGGDPRSRRSHALEKMNANSDIIDSQNDKLCVSFSGRRQAKGVRHEAREAQIAALACRERAGGR